MTFDELSEVCLSLPEARVDYPFDEHTAAFRAGNKIFALCSRKGDPLRVNLKGDPALNRDLRVSYPEIVPGWHMNKEHWNTVGLEGNLSTDFVASLIGHSHDLVTKKTKRR